MSNKPNQEQASVSAIALGTGICTRIRGLKPRQPPGFLVSYGEQRVLLDCSQGIADRLALHDLEPHHIRHVLLSHTHPDHCAVPQFIQDAYCHFLFNREGEQQGDRSSAYPLSVYVPAELMRDFEATLRFQFPETEGKLWNDFPCNAHQLTGEERLELGDFEVQVKRVYHGFNRCPSFGFRIKVGGKVIAYTGDAGFPPDGDPKTLVALAQDADLLIADSGTRIGKEYVGGYGHMGSRQCGEIARQAGVKELWLTHYSGLDSNEAMLAEVDDHADFDGRLVVAQDNQRWPG